MQSRVGPNANVDILRIVRTVAKAGFVFATKKNVHLALLCQTENYLGRGKEPELVSQTDAVSKSTNAYKETNIVLQ